MAKIQAEDIRSEKRQNYQLALMKLHYIPRVAGTTMLTAILGTIYYKTSDLKLILFIAGGLTWPHLAYFGGKRLAGHINAAFWAFYFESFLFGIITSLISFSLFPTAAFLLGTVINSTSTGGFTMLMRSVLFYCAGAGLTVLAAGFTFAPEAGVVTSLLSILTTLTYCALISNINFSLELNIHRKKEQIQEAKEIIQDQYRIIEQQKNGLEHEIQMAKKIQESLLPRMIPNSLNIAMSYRYVPMLDIGGDFVDIIYDPLRNEVGLFICDVSGHGVSAAMTASMVKIALNSWSRNLSNPATVLQRIGTHMVGKMGGNFLTASICYIDLNTGQLSYSNAGHCPLIVLHPDGMFDLIQYRGRAIMEYRNNTVEYGDVDYQLRKGDKVILYTDGIIEARDRNGVMLGENQFIDIVREFHSLGSGEICDKIYDAVSRHIQPFDKFDDDFTILIAEFNDFASTPHIHT